MSNPFCLIRQLLFNSINENICQIILVDEESNISFWRELLSTPYMCFNLTSAQ